MLSTAPWTRLESKVYRIDIQAKAKAAARRAMSDIKPLTTAELAARAEQRQASLMQAPEPPHAAVTAWLTATRLPAAGAEPECDERENVAVHHMRLRRDDTVWAWLGALAITSAELLPFLCAVHTAEHPTPSLYWLVVHEIYTQLLDDGATALAHDAFMRFGAACVAHLYPGISRTTTDRYVQGEWGALLGCAADLVDTGVEAAAQRRAPRRRSLHRRSVSGAGADAAPGLPVHCLGQFIATIMEPWLCASVGASVGDAGFLLETQILPLAAAAVPHQRAPQAPGSDPLPLSPTNSLSLRAPDLDALPVLSPPHRLGVSRASIASTDSTPSSVAHRMAGSSVSTVRALRGSTSAAEPGPKAASPALRSPSNRRMSQQLAPLAGKR
jgi:hypothetical protein